MSRRTSARAIKRKSSGLGIIGGMHDESLTRSWPARIQIIRQELESRLDEDVPLEDLARMADASMFHFHRVFRGMTGETVRSYTRRLRLERAAKWLRYRMADDLLEIALKSGYGSHEAFSRAFKSEFDCSPSEYRDRAASSPPPQPIGPPPGELAVEVRETPAQHVAYVRHTGPYTDVAAAWEELMRWGWTRMLFRQPAAFGLCYDDPDITEGHKLRYDACLEVGRRTKDTERMHVRRLERGRYAVTVHEGGFSSIGATYARLCCAILERPTRWTLAESPSREVYLSDPRSTPEEEMRTEIWMPISAR